MRGGGGKGGGTGNSSCFPWHAVTSTARHAVTVEGALVSTGNPTTGQKTLLLIFFFFLTLNEGQQRPTSSTEVNSALSDSRSVLRFV